jgi:dynein heavy chain
MPEVGNLEWLETTIKNADNGPVKRSGHSVTIIGLPNNPSLIVIGGFTEAGHVNDVWQLKLGAEQVEWVKPKIGQPDYAPSPRWRHSANLLPNGKGIFVFGGMSSKQRFDDCYLLSTSSTFRWSIPKVTGAVPEPRANHSMTMVGDKFFLFGGYGGKGYTRTMFNDLYSLDTVAMEWSKITASGKLPDPRSNHATISIRDQLFVLGGRSFTETFDDLYVLDLEAMKWSQEKSVTTPEPLYNHSGVGCMAVPTWKAFFFGGRTGGYTTEEDTRKYSDQILVLDADNMQWMEPPITGQAPSAREDTTLVYDSKNSRMIVFGGWSDDLHSDIHSLDVSMIVGPPYAVMGIVPQIGPVDGGSEVIIQGVGFEDTPMITVRFAFGKGDTFAEAPGVFVSPTEIKCTTPNFEELGPRKVDVRISMKGDAMTTTKTSYTFFENTKADNCVVFGPGCRGELAVGIPTQVVIQAVDGAGQARTSGGDSFTVEVCNTASGAMVGDIDIKDNDDGTYLITYSVEDSAKYNLDIMYKDNQLNGSPFSCTFKQGVAEDVNQLNGGPALERLTAEVAELSKFALTNKAGLAEEVKGGEGKKLLKVMGHLFDVKERSGDVRSKLDQNREYIAFLKKYHNVNKTRELSSLKEADENFKGILKAMPEVRSRIAQPMKIEAQATRTKVEEFTLKCKKYRQLFKANTFFQFETGPQESYKGVEEARSDLKGEMLRTQKDLVSVCRVYEFPDAMDEASGLVNDCDADLDSIVTAWKNAEKIASTFEEFNECPWTDVDAESMEEEAKKMMKDTRSLDRRIRWSDTYKQQETTVKNMLVALPLVADLRHPSMRDRHWAELMKVTNTNFEITASFKLRDLLELELHKFGDDVGEIVDQAQKEEKMEQTLKTLNETWGEMELEYQQHKDTDLKLVSLNGDAFDILEDNQLLVQNMMASKYLNTFEEEVTGWQNKLATVADVITIMSEIQRTWAYLEELFINSEEVKKELPEDAKVFEGIHKEIRAILKDAEKQTNVVKMCCTEGLFEKLEENKEKLELCEKSLSDYLDAKKRVFPRFYFTSTTDLLDMLSNGNQPFKIMPHMPKVICGIAELVLEGDPNSDVRPIAKGMVASVGIETVDFTPPFQLKNKIESYLQDVIDAMQKSLRDATLTSLKKEASSVREEWLYQDPAQITVLVSQMSWVKEVEKQLDALKGGNATALSDYSAKFIGGLSNLIAMARTPLSKPERTRVMVLITMDTHNRDINIKLIKENVVDKENFLWASQLRPKWLEEESKAQFFICDAHVDYGNEYLGNGPRLVVTPLTDRIYVTATQAQHLCMGCAPAGPAGTGKTETTKDLSSNCAVPIYVFNCAPEMDYRSLGDIFKGLAASGAWGCFDEFNRLIPEVLSVCTVQYKAVTDAIKGGLKEFMLQGDMMTLIPSAMSFITMNPGYLGRSELPEGLKALFRPITVMVPDFGLICENMLMAEGFETAAELGKRFYVLYALLKDLLSKQMHYDWGLRAIKSVLVVAGGFKRAEPELEEADILMRALRDFNIPKIVADDMPIFMGLLGDLFPGRDPPRKRDMDFEALLTGEVIGSGLHPDDEFILKTVQLGELLEIRHCVFVMGPAGCGKSQTWNCLAKAKNKAQQDFTHLFPNQSTKDGGKVLTKDVNPKSISTNELYGYVNMSTREWKDGLLSSTMRDLGNMADKNPKWILLDGDLDANWIESMNSVMDDNKILTLPSNERITLYPHMRMIFEIRDLKFATPATASRAGILFISDDDGYQWKAIVQAWVKSRDESEGFSPEIKANMTELFEKYLGPTLYQLKLAMKTIIPMVDMQLVQTALHLLEGLLTPAVMKGPSVELVESYVVFSCVWAFGSSLFTKDNIDYKKEFSGWWKSEFKTVKFPTRGTIFDYYVDEDEKKFEPWTKIVPVIEYDPEIPMTQVTVPTPETFAIDFILDLLIPRRYPALLVGEAGTGKTQQMLGKLRKMQAESEGDYIFSNINFNYYTDSEALQGILEASLEKKAGINFGPPGKSKLIYLVDDLNMPQLDPYDTQMAIALMRQHFDYGHWYDRNKFTLKNVANVQFVSCMNPAAGSSVVNPRLQRWYMVFAVEIPGGESLYTIYNTFLEGHLKVFPEEVQALSSNLIRAALNLHTGVAQTFRKTAVNFHYEFNIRHLARVFQGLLGSRPEQFKDPDKMVRLWLHESERVYGDILVSYDDMGKYAKLSQGVGKKLFASVNIDRFFAKENPDLLIYNHFANGDLQDKLYNEVADVEGLGRVLNDALNEYNETNAAMPLVLFTDAMKHICRVTRVINNPSGHALLVGVGGMGKQSLSRLSAHICGYTTVQIQISQAYTINSSPGLKEDLKTMYTKAGLKEEGISFLFTDSQIADEKFLVYLNDLLSSGDIPDLFAPDEKDNIINGIRGRAKAAGLPDTRDACWDFLCLCFSPVGEDMARRARRFPALINCTSIDWFQPWPQSALLSVAQKYLGEIEGGLGDEEITENIVKFMPYSFGIVQDTAAKFFAGEKRNVYMTPKSFLELLEFYKGMLTDKRKKTDEAINRLDTGLTKLLETAESVSVMEEELKVKSVEVAEKKEKAEGIAETVGKEKAIVDEQAAAAGVEGDKCDVIAKEASAIQVSAETDLAKAEPAVREAEAALDGLDKKDLGEAKGMAKPPGGVDDVFAAVLVLLANAGGASDIATDKKGKPKDVSWKAAQLLMKDVNGFINRLKGVKPLIDSDQVPKCNFDHIRQYLDLDYFSYDGIVTKSKAAAGCCAFVVNIVIYYDIVVTVEPKRESLRQATEKLNDATAKLNIINAEVAILQEKLAVLTAEFNEANDIKEAAIAESDACERKLNLAQRLVNALSSEKVRWAENIEVLKGSYSLLVGDCLLASAFVSYIGAFTRQYRQILIEEEWVPWLMENKIPMSDTVDPLKILTDDAEMAGWNSEGLPSDRVSTENGTIVCNSSRFPLMIDPQLQGIAWIKERESKRDLQVTRLTNKNMITVFERSLEAGNSVLVENMGETIEAVLSNVVGRKLFKKGRSMYVTLGDKEVEFSPNFKLFLHTKLSNPHYAPEVQAETTLINFSVTEDGLEDQLLALVVRKERPDLENSKAKLISDQNGFKIKMKELEDDLLQRLAAAEGDITEDVDLIENLEESKRIATDIAEKQIVAAETEISINAARENYRSVASRGSLLFFLMNALNKIHTFYQYSLNAYVVVFQRGIDLVSAKPKVNPLLRLRAAASRVMKSSFSWNVDVLKAARAQGGGGQQFESSNQPEPQSEEELTKRLDVLLNSIQYSVFNYIRRGLFERDKLTMATQLCLWVLRKDGQIDNEEIQNLIVGAQKDTGDQMSANLAEWLPESAWLGLQALKDLPAFATLATDMDNSPELWKRWYDLEKPETADMPKEYKSMDLWKKILVLRCIRSDRVAMAMYTYCKEQLGPKYVDEDAFDMRAAYNESSPSTPIFFVLFPGVDPTKDVESLGNALGFTQDKGNYINISMGQGQEEVAERSLDNFAKNGGWVFLQNVHLMQSWLPALERRLEVCAENGHDDFRCFISAEQPMFAGKPAPMVRTIPESILQSCIKVANEAPADAKANLRMAYANFSAETTWEKMDGDVRKMNDCKNSLMTLCVFHTMLLGRKKFGCQGWSRAYPFNTGDLTISANVLVSFCKNNPAMPYSDLRYLFGEIMYGGHITDPWDRRTDNTYLEVLLGEFTQAGFQVVPGFKLPNPEGDPANDEPPLTYSDYVSYIETELPDEDPTMYGLHTNAGISNQIDTCNFMFDTIMTLQGAGGGGGGGGKSKDEVVKGLVEEYTERLPDDFNMFEIRSRAIDKTPYVMIVLQETTRMNVLLSEMRRSLIELKMGLEGALNMSDTMEALAASLFVAKVPAGWAKYAYPSKKGLVAWFSDLLSRVNQLDNWAATLEVPKSVWISGLFNGQAFLVSIKQTTARRDQLPLDTMDLLTDITKIQSAEMVDAAVEDGCLVDGFFVEGARWNSEEGCLAESRLKDLHPPLPVMHVYSRAAPAYDDRVGQMSGGLRVAAEYYECPAFITSDRGATFVFEATMKMAEGDKASKWVLAGVALMMSEE